MTQEAFVLIGAGSTVFTPGLLNDLARSRTFDGFAVRLVDVVPEAAETMARLGRRIAEAAGSTMTVEAATDRREALRDARFVATTIAVGSAAGWRADLDIPEAYGIHQTVGDSVGPGGVLRASSSHPGTAGDRGGHRRRRSRPRSWSTTATRSPRTSAPSPSTRR